MINLKQTSSGTTNGLRDVYNERSPLILINQIARLEFSRIAKENGSEFYFNESARLVLIKISENEGCTQQDIVKVTHMKKPTVSVIMSNFEKNGLINKTVDSVDRRATRITLTEKGRAAIAELQSFLSKEEKVAADGLTVNEYEMLVKLLSKVRYNLSDGRETQE